LIGSSERRYDTPEMTQLRLRQANLFGSAGFVSADDGEVIEFSQNNFDVNDARSTLADMSWIDVAAQDDLFEGASIAVTPAGHDIALHCIDGVLRLG
jgi:hypothetical protein